jgi:hypothetical protein
MGGIFDVRIGGALFFLFGNISRGIPLEISSPFKPFSLETSALETCLRSHNSKSPPEEGIANSQLTDR